MLRQRLGGRIAACPFKAPPHGSLNLSSARAVISIADEDAPSGEYHGDARRIVPMQNTESDKSLLSALIAIEFESPQLHAGLARHKCRKKPPGFRTMRTAGCVEDRDRNDALGVRWFGLSVYAPDRRHQCDHDGEQAGQFENMHTSNKAKSSKPALTSLKLRHPHAVERVLQDDCGSELVDHFRTPLARLIGGNQHALGFRRRQPLVPQ